MIQFFLTAMGKRFYEGHVPKALHELTRLNDNLESLIEVLKRKPKGEEGSE